MPLRHFIDTQDFTKAELLEMIELTRMIKAADRQGCTPKLLADATLAMIFEEPSTRTRVSFEVGMVELGGHAMHLKPGDIFLGVRESVHDIAKVLSRMCDAIFAHTLKHTTIVELVRHAEVPVLNGRTDYNDPTQVVSDVLTMIEYLPMGKKLEDLRVTFVGDATSVLSSLMMICTRMGMHFTQAAPVKYQAPAGLQKMAQGNCKESGGTLTITDDPLEAVQEADFVYTDLWWWLGQENEISERRAAFMPDYQVNRSMIQRMPSHCMFMHCLPASRGLEVTEEVMDHPRSIIFDQSENRLHTEKGLLVYFVYPHLKRPSDALKAYHAGRIEEFMKNKA